MHVLKDLPKKHHQVEYCEMPPEQRVIYDDILAKQKDQIAARARGEIPARDGNNVLMQLRKAASHPLLFRRIYDDVRIGDMSREIMREEKYGTPEHSQEAIFEDMQYMWDFTLHKLCLEHRASIGRFALSNEEWMMAGKVDVLKRLLPEMKARGDRVLLFSFFTMVLDILERVLDSLGVLYMRLDGQTKVDERQEMIDQFHEEEDVTVFLLSTKAGKTPLTPHFLHFIFPSFFFFFCLPANGLTGGFGINLACANTVIIFDGSFNPHDDKQAEDRAHRVGQTRDVTVIRLVVKDTIEEHILHLANTKLALDQEMSSSITEDDEKAEQEGEKFVARMLIGKNGEETPAAGTSTVPSRVVTPALLESS
jgi:SWI/SNF-related matrix-associated actin-dependent regulator of chromatin subfamily A containing DEAD/H box 1